MTIFVSCSSSDKLDQKYYDLANNLGEYIKKNNWNLIFSGGTCGMLGKLYESIQGTKGKVISVTAPQYLKSIENLKFDQIISSKNSYEDIDYMIKNGDVSLFLPSGIGGMSELLLSIYTKKTKEHNKEIIVVNIDNYFNSFLEMMAKFNKENFINENDIKLYQIVNSLEEAIELIKEIENKTIN